MENVITFNPVKYLIKDLKNKQVPFDVWLQGRLEGSSDNNVIISDPTGHAMVSCCNCKDMDKSRGNYYCVLGVMASASGDLPVIKAAKFIKISSNHECSWETEVREAQLLLNGLSDPKL